MIYKIIPLILMLILSSCSSAPTRAESLELMTPDEKSYVQKLESSFSSETTLTVMKDLLGEPYRGSVYLRVEWLVEGLDSTKVIAYFENEKLYKIKYVSINPYFVYEIDYPKNKI